jgi:type I restriction-modification system DNA methylase subunit
MAFIIGTMDMILHGIEAPNIRYGIDLFTPAECQNDFAAAGYDRD